MNWQFSCIQRLAFVSGLGLFLICNAAPTRAQSPPVYRSDQILVRPRSGISVATLNQFHALQKDKVLRAFARIGRLQVVSVPPGQTVEGLIAKYQKSGLVEFAEPDYLVYADATTPNDPYYTNGLLWGLNNYGQNGGTSGADIDAPDAWDVRTSASNIVVAVLDSGIRATHEDLAANMWVNPNDGGHGYNAFTGTNDPSDDGTSHGTMVAGVLGAVGNNAKGVTGVAWQVRMMACKCLNNGTGSDSTVTACIDYAIANGARIINASFDTPTSSLVLSNAIVAARDAGILWVASAGNGNPGFDIDITPTYPSCYGIDNVVSVAYTTRTDGLGSLSNYGATNVDIGAPGDQVYTTFAATDSYYYPPSGLGINIAGTSFAAPCVSGACALLMVQYPADTYQDTITRLLSSTDPLPALAGKCRTGGRLDLRKALRTILLSILPTSGNEPFQMRVSGGINRTCAVQTSTDLVNWTPVFTNTAAVTGTFDFTNIIAAGSAQQFFRAVAAP
jgi:hypothetical protein